ncbi:transposase, partial [Acinetobacter kookii]
MDSLPEQIQMIEHFPLEKTCVHIIDREGDSFAHLRVLSGHGFQWLIRAKDGNRIEHLSEICKVGEVAERIEIQQVKPISY